MLNMHSCSWWGLAMYWLKCVSCCRRGRNKQEGRGRNEQEGRGRKKREERREYVWASPLKVQQSVFWTQWCAGKTWQSISVVVAASIVPEVSLLCILWKFRVITHSPDGRHAVGCEQCWLIPYCSLSEFNLSQMNTVQIHSLISFVDVHAGQMGSVTPIAKGTRNILPPGCPKTSWITGLRRQWLFNPVKVLISIDWQTDQRTKLIT